MNTVDADVSQRSQVARGSKPERVTKDVPNLLALDAAMLRIRDARAELAAIAEELGRRRSAVNMASAAVKAAERRLASARKQNGRNGEEKSPGLCAQVERQLGREEARYAEGLAAYERQIQESDRSRRGLQTKLERLRSEAEGLRRQLPAALLEQYDDSVAEHEAALTQATPDGTCAACQAFLPDEILAVTNEPTGIVPCPRCRRLLCVVPESGRQKEPGGVSGRSVKKPDGLQRRGHDASGAAVSTGEMLFQTP